MQSFFRVFRLDSTLMAAMSDRGKFRNCANPVCPPLYLMLILCVLGVKIRYVICLFIVMSAMTGRTHVDWRFL